MGQLLRIDNGQPFATFSSKVVNSDGSVSFVEPQTNNYIGQNPGVYGGRNDNTEAKQYQRATQVSPNIVTFMPLADFPPYLYILVEGQVYPA